MSTTRISLTDSGIRLTFVRMRSSSSRAVPRGRNATSIGRSAASSALTSSSTRGPKPSGSGSNSKSMRADSGSMFPPVTGTRHSFQMTPHSTWSAVWVRMSACRRSQSTDAGDRRCPAPAAGHHRRCARPGRPPCARPTTARSPRRAGVVGLATAGRVEGGAVERHRSLALVDDGGGEVAEVRVAEVEQLGGHALDSGPLEAARAPHLARIYTPARWAAAAHGGRFEASADRGGAPGAGLVAIGAARRRLLREWGRRGASSVPSDRRRPTPPCRRGRNVDGHLRLGVWLPSSGPAAILGTPLQAGRRAGGPGDQRRRRGQRPSCWRSSTGTRGATRRPRTRPCSELLGRGPGRRHRRPGVVPRRPRRARRPGRGARRHLLADRHRPRPRAAARRRATSCAPSAPRRWRPSR